MSGQRITGRVVVSQRAKDAAADLRRRAADKWSIAARSRNPAVAAKLRVEAAELDARAAVAESGSQRVLM